VKPLHKIILALCVCVGLLGAAFYGCGEDPKTAASTVRVATKNFTEQLILGELMAQLIEAKTDLHVKRQFNLGGTMICHGALVNGEIDLYPEYTGTGLTAVLHQEVIAQPDSAYRVVARAYETQFNSEWLQPFGFNNTYAITAREQDAKSKGWKTIEDLRGTASGLQAGFTAEFSERQDGYPGLRKAYGFGFGTVRDLDPGLMYGAIVQNEVDVICAFATDGRIAAYNLKPLEDNRGFFPPYYAAPVVRREVLQAHPELRRTLGLLSGILDDATMQKLNYRVDEEKRAPADVARKFLESKGLLESAKEG